MKEDQDGEGVGIFYFDAAKGEPKDLPSHIEYIEHLTRNGPGWYCAKANRDGSMLSLPLGPFKDQDEALEKGVMALLGDRVKPKPGETVVALLKAEGLGGDPRYHGPAQLGVVIANGGSGGVVQQVGEIVVGANEDVGPVTPPRVGHLAEA